jgi:exopolyphosphatase/pppGpp-phosphohydrolase
LNTLSELATALKTHEDAYDALLETVGKKADKTELHSHSNKDILDNTTASFTEEEKTKLAGLENYSLPTDVVKDSNYVHTDNNFTTAEKEKLENLVNYNDTALTNRVVELEKVDHTHLNKEILDNTTASFTTELKTKLENVEGQLEYTTVADIEALFPAIEPPVGEPTLKVGNVLVTESQLERLIMFLDTVEVVEE